MAKKNKAPRHMGRDYLNDLPLSFLAPTLSENAEADHLLVEEQSFSP